MAPQLLSTNVFGLNLMDIDLSHHLSSKTDRGCHARPRSSVKTWKIWHGNPDLFLG
jgi:hypothetical protein